VTRQAPQNVFARFFLFDDAFSLFFTDVNPAVSRASSRDDHHADMRGLVPQDNPIDRELPRV
jgi:hypothetical protein